MSDFTKTAAFTLRRPSQVLAASWGAAAVLLAGGDLFYEKHPHVSYEGWFNFYGFLAAATVLACLALTFVARPCLTRPEGYYHE